MKEKINILHNTEVEQFFKKIGMLTELNNGEIRCEECGNIITLNNFRLVFKENNELKFLCNKELCFQYRLSK